MITSMMSSDDHDFPTPELAERRRASCSSLPLSPFLMINGHLSSKSFASSYIKLPKEPLKLTVLKLDGSSFDVKVIKSATVLELKQAVEDVFTHLQQNGPAEVSWTHVWGHFCLCYGGRKLLIENDSIKRYGIKDGDQLHFIRHRSVNFNPMKKRANKRPVQQEKISYSRSDSNEDNEQNYVEEGVRDDQEFDDNDSIISNAPRLANFLTRWFSYSRLAASSDPRSVSIETGLYKGIKSFLRSKRFV